MLHSKIKAIPVLAPVTLVALAVVIWWLRRQGSLTAPRVAVGVVACVYAAGVLGETLFPFRIDTSNEQSWRVWLHLTPFTDVVADPIGIVLNVALFMPLGIIIPLVAPLASVRHVLLCGFAASLTIEVIQFVGDITANTGRVADVDDLIGNTLGTLIGYIVFRLIALIPAASRIAARSSWPSPRRTR
jgi:glycopeptide antibiotics resistance protein